MKRWRIGLLGALVSLLAVYFVVRQINIELLWSSLTRARYFYVFPTVMFLLAGLVTRAFRWRVLLSDGLSPVRAFSIMNVAYLVNGVLPLRIGELARIYLATRAEPPIPAFKTASTIIVERLLDLLAVVLLAALALAAGPIPDELRAYALFGGVTAFGGFLILVVLSARREFALRLLTAVVGRFDRDTGQERLTIARRISVWFVHFLDGLLPLAKPRALFQALVWTVLSWGFSVVAGYILMFAFYPQASWTATCLYIAAAAFAIAVPAVPGNLGPYEGSIILALGAMGFGQPSETATAFAIVVHGVNLAVHATTGVIGFIQEGISLEQLSQGVREMRQ